MRHVDDGMLHAWLDGEVTDREAAAWIEEHLRGCNECRARLAEERATIEQSDALLTRAAPDVGTPPFERLVGRAGAPMAASARSPRWVMPASWAASVALASVLGWVVRDGAQRDQSSLETALRVSEAPIVSVPDVPDAPVASRGNAAEAPIADAVAAPPAAPQTQAASPRAVIAPGAPQRASRAEPAGGTLADAADLASGAPAAPQNVETASPQPPLARPTALGGTVSMTERTAALSIPGWRAVPRTEAAAITRMPLYGIDGLVPTLTAVDTRNARVRTLYRLPSGEVIELLQEAVKGPAAGLEVPPDQTAAGGGLEPNGLAPLATPPVWSGVRGEARLTLRTQGGTSTVSELNSRLRLD